MSIFVDSLANWLRRPPAQGTEASSESTSASTTGGDLDLEPVVVWRATHQMEAEVVKGRLESAGIPAIIRGEALGAIYGLTSGSLAEMSVLVPAPLAEKAEALLYGETAEDSAITVDGETVEDGTVSDDSDAVYDEYSDRSG